MIADVDGAVKDYDMKRMWVDGFGRYLLKDNLLRRDLNCDEDEEEERNK